MPVHPAGVKQQADRLAADLLCRRRWLARSEQQLRQSWHQQRCAQLLTAHARPLAAQGTTVRQWHAILLVARDVLSVSYSPQLSCAAELSEAREGKGCSAHPQVRTAVQAGFTIQRVQGARQLEAVFKPSAVGFPAAAEQAEGAPARLPHVSQ